MCDEVAFQEDIFKQRVNVVQPTKLNRKSVLPVLFFLYPRQSPLRVVDNFCGEAIIRRTRNHSPYTESYKNYEMFTTANPYGLRRLASCTQFEVDTLYCSETIDQTKITPCTYDGRGSFYYLFRIQIT